MNQATYFGNYVTKSEAERLNKFTTGLGMEYQDITVIWLTKA